MTPARFTPSEDEAIQKGGWDDRTLADMLFMPIDTLRARRTELSAPPPAPKKAKPADHYWKPEELATVRTMHRAGERWKVIARAVDRSQKAVEAKWRRISKCS